MKNNTFFKAHAPIKLSFPFIILVSLLTTFQWSTPSFADERSMIMEAIAIKSISDYQQANTQEQKDIADSRIKSTLALEEAQRADDLKKQLDGCSGKKGKKGKGGDQSDQIKNEIANLTSDSARQAGQAKADLADLARLQGAPVAPPTTPGYPPPTGP